MSAVLSAEILRARRRGVTSSEHTTKHGAMAQLVAHHTGSVGVRGSSPLSSTIIPGQKTWDSLFLGLEMPEGDTNSRGGTFRVAMSPADC